MFCCQTVAVVAATTGMDTRTHALSVLCQ